MPDLLTVEVRRAIEQERDRRNLSTNTQLARELDILPKHLSRWQNGHFTRLDRILVNLVLQSRDSSPSSS